MLNNSMLPSGFSCVVIEEVYTTVLDETTKTIHYEYSVNGSCKTNLLIKKSFLKPERDYDAQFELNREDIYNKCISI